jgi:glutathione peroxidase
MSLYDIEIAGIDGSPDLLGRNAGKLALFVNVASRCGFTYQYEALVALHRRFADQGFTVVGFPCNQFLGQEPGTADEIQSFCSLTFGVDFPLSEKIEVNGEARHPVYEQLTLLPDDDGYEGDVRWNFEKFLVSPAGEVVGRWATGVEPDDERIVAAIETHLSD